MDAVIDLAPELGANAVCVDYARTFHTAHFLRQSIITKRRQVDWVNRRWYQNQQFTLKKRLWTR